MYLKFIGCPMVRQKTLGTRAFIALDTPFEFLNKTEPIKAWDQNGQHEGDYYILSVECVTYPELEYAANSLIKELEKIKKEAKTFFEKERGK